MCQLPDVLRHTIRIRVAGFRITPVLRLRYRTGAIPDAQLLLRVVMRCSTSQRRLQRPRHDLKTCFPEQMESIYRFIS